MAAVQLQATGLTEAQRAVRDHFQEGGSIGSVLLVVGVVAGVILAACWLARRQRRRAQKHAPRDDPDRLFGDLLRGLALTAPQRGLLDTVAKELRLRNPAVILLSPTLFDRHVDQWRALNHQACDHVDPRADERIVAQVRAVLFPSV